MARMNEIEESIDNDDSENQKLRDRRMRESHRKLSNKYEHLKNRQLWKIKLAKYLIDDLKNYGPANLLYIDALSIVTRRPIRVWRSKGRLYRTIGDRTNESSIRNPIDIEYHGQPGNPIGHWTLLSNKDPIDVKPDLNTCLFAVISAQTEKSVDDLKTNMIDFLTNNTKNLIDQIDKFVSENGRNEASLMIGGARYVGNSPRDAAVIIDNSQNVLCHTCTNYGHPRGHASDINATGPNDSVENYSRTTSSMKSGFLSRNDQNKVAHLALSHAKAIEAMRQLNNGVTSLAVTLSRRELQSNNNGLPKMKEYFNGVEYSGILDIIRVTLVLRHHQGKYNDPNADVFVHTFYPRNS